MMLKQLLQGRPFGHPLHPMLVHLPIALFLLSFILDIASFSTTQANAFTRAAFYTMALGVVTALLAAVTGMADYSEIRRDHPARRIGKYHMLLNVAAVAIYTVNVALRWPRSQQEGDAVLPFVLSVVGVALLSVSGYLGGVMVYDDGIAVGRHRRKTDLPDVTIARSAADARDGFVVVADEGDLKDGQTLRASVNDVVLTIARVDGQLYAFQEFCTHRFGPLSEGSFDGEQVRCPWHGSCFDMKSGKVTGGPAKEDIRVFEVQVREGKVTVRLPEHPVA